YLRVLTCSPGSVTLGEPARVNETKRRHVRPVADRSDIPRNQGGGVGCAATGMFAGRRTEHAAAAGDSRGIARTLEGARGLADLKDGPPRRGGAGWRRGVDRPARPPALPHRWGAAPRS